jgi:hypothetical protein
MIVFHVSEEPDIEVFEPRKAATRGERVVWAIDGDHLRNDLAPRDCPRVTYSVGPGTTVADHSLAECNAAAVRWNRWRESLAPGAIVDAWVLLSSR